MGALVLRKSCCPLDGKYLRPLKVRHQLLLAAIHDRLCSLYHSLLAPCTFETRVPHETRVADSMEVSELLIRRVCTCFFALSNFAT